MTVAPQARRISSGVATKTLSRASSGPWSSERSVAAIGSIAAGP
jgi:hypothetical protein